MAKIKLNDFGVVCGNIEDVPGKLPKIYWFDINEIFAVWEVETYSPGYVEIRVISKNGITLRVGIFSEKEAKEWHEQFIFNKMEAR